MSREIMLWDKVVFGAFQRRRRGKRQPWAPWHNSANHSRVLLGILALAFL
jgi:hypothetical protein